MNNTRIRRAELNSPVHFLAQFFSIIFHPIAITTYLAAFLIFVHPAAFTGFEPQAKLFRFLTVFVSTFFLPIFSIFICWRLKLIQSLYLKTSRERIIPYVLVMFFYWWAFYVFRNLPDSPSVIVHLLFGSFLAICGGWMCNIFFKISMHAIAMGGMLMFAFLFTFNDNYSSGLYISVAFLITGLVSTSRFLVSDHTPREIYFGLVVGLLAQLIGWYFPL